MNRWIPTCFQTNTRAHTKKALQPHPSSYPTSEGPRTTLGPPSSAVCFPKCLKCCGDEPFTQVVLLCVCFSRNGGRERGRRDKSFAHACRYVCVRIVVLYFPVILFRLHGRDRPLCVRSLFVFCLGFVGLRVREVRAPSRVLYLYVMLYFSVILFHLHGRDRSLCAQV